MRSLNETSNDKTIDKDISGNDKIIDKNISKFDIAIISYSCVCTITLIILITKRKKEYN